MRPIQVKEIAGNDYEFYDNLSPETHCSAVVIRSC